MTRRQVLSRAVGGTLWALTVAVGLSAAQAPAGPGDAHDRRRCRQGSLAGARRSEGAAAARVEVKTEDGTTNIYEGVSVAELLMLERLEVVRLRK